MVMHILRSDGPLITTRLVRQKSEASRLNANVVVTPIETSWNDFGYVLRAEIGFRIGELEREWVNAFFAFKGHKNLSIFTLQILADSSDGVALDDIDFPYASMLNDTKSYSLIRNRFGPDLGRRLLLAIHDVSILDDEGEHVTGWHDFTLDEAFTHSFTRTSEGHFAFRHGAKILAGRGDGDIDARQSINVELTSGGPSLRFNFNFTGPDAIRGRMAAIIGKNGCGKTSSLARIAAGLAVDKQRGVAFEHRPLVNQVLVFAHSSALQNFRQRRDRVSAASVRVFALDPSARRSPARERHTRLLVDMARSFDEYGSALEEFKQLISTELSGLRMFLPLRSDAVDGVAKRVMILGSAYIEISNWMKGGEARKLAASVELDHQRKIIFLDEQDKPRTLSLGQLAFLNFALNALANAGSGSVFLIDEPENFLHPNLISRFMRVIHRVVEGTKSIALLATHSPFVVRELQSSQVHVIRSNSAEVVDVVQPRLQTLGANVATIANEVFGDDLADHLYEVLLKESNITTLPFEQVLKQYEGQLSTEALMYVRRCMETINRSKLQ